MLAEGIIPDHEAVEVHVITERIDLDVEVEFRLGNRESIWLGQIGTGNPGSSAGLFERNNFQRRENLAIQINLVGSKPESQTPLPSQVPVTPHARAVAHRICVQLSLEQNARAGMRWP